MTIKYMKKINSIHFVGIKGVGMTPLAIIAKQAGMNVTGSDNGKTFITDTALQQVGIDRIYNGFSAEHIDQVDLVITTVAHDGLKNPEVLAAKEKGIPIWTQAEAVGKFMEGSIFDKAFQGISVTGTHGKTTTTSMVATLLQQANLDPSYVIGTSTIPSLKNNGLPGNLGHGEYFIAEADEYVGEYEENGEIKKQTRFLWQHPKYVIMTSLELDHPDVYANVEEIEKSFLQFAKQLPEDGVLIYNGDEERLQKIAEQVSCKRIAYGRGKTNKELVYVAGDILDLGTNGTRFTLSGMNQSPYPFLVKVNGEHNVLNALAAFCLGQAIGLNSDQIQNGLQTFKGSKRRLEKVVPTNPELPKDPIYYDDYAHHPTEIKATLKTLRSMYPDYYIVCIFQPHTYSRTKALFSEFTHSFNDADEIIITDIFSSAREQPDSSVSSESLVKAILNIKSDQKKIIYQDKLPNVVKYIGQQGYPAKTIIITMGAGDVYTIFS
jgi:UDP-N-acetylmuramate--alanine ligase